MAEMTWQEAVKRLLITGSPVLFEIAALIQQQAQTIAELQTEIAYQNKQIARLQEDLNEKQGGKP